MKDNRNGSGYILALDQGTTSSRALLFTTDGRLEGVSKRELPQIFPKPGWVEHNPADIWSGQASVITEVLTSRGVRPEEIVSIGITNQRETTIVWDRKTGKPVYNAIVWQDRRTHELCSRLKKDGSEVIIREKTGLLADPYFSATKISWILDNVAGARKRADNGELLFGTVDSWLIWNLSGGKVHATDVTNASRTLLYNIYTLEWDNDLLKMFNIPASMLPEVKPSVADFCNTSSSRGELKTMVTGVAGDQQAALFGQLCTSVGMVKNTYGTGCFMIMNTGEKAVKSNNKLLTTIAWSYNNKVTYGLEGSVFIAGAIIQWLRDGLNILSSAAESEAIATSVKDTGGVYFVPALSGLGAPYWDPTARGLISGLTRGSNRGHIVRAALESIAYQSYDILKAMEEDIGKPITGLRVDGGASANDFLMQFQAELLGIEVIRPEILETTALGAAYFAGLGAGVWKDEEEIRKYWKPERNFTPSRSGKDIEKLLKGWHDTVGRSTPGYSG